MKLKSHNIWLLKKHTPLFNNLRSHCRSISAGLHLIILFTSGTLLLHSAVANFDADFDVDSPLKVSQIFLWYLWTLWPHHQVNEHVKWEEGYEAGVKWCQSLNHTWGVQACNTGRKYVLTAQSHLFYGLSIRGSFDTFDVVSDLP